MKNILQVYWPHFTSKQTPKNVQHFSKNILLCSKRSVKRLATCTFNHISILYSYDLYLSPNQFTRKFCPSIIFFLLFSPFATKTSTLLGSKRNKFEINKWKYTYRICIIFWDWESLNVNNWRGFFVGDLFTKLGHPLKHKLNLMSLSLILLN